MHSVILEVVMRRRARTTVLILLVSAVGGCALPGVASAPRLAANGQYVCRSGSNAATPAPDLRLTVRSSNQPGRLMVRVREGGWQSLTQVTGESGPLYADAAYAWRFNGAAGVLSDIRNIQSYNCVAEDVTRWAAQ
jgi:hypothetical protein